MKIQLYENQIHAYVGMRGKQKAYYMNLLEMVVHTTMNVEHLIEVINLDKHPYYCALKIFKSLNFIFCIS